MKSAAPARGRPGADDTDGTLPAVLELSEDNDLSDAGELGDAAGLSDAGGLGDAADLSDAADLTPPPRVQHGARERSRARDLFERLSGLPPDDPERLRIRSELVELHLPLVEYLARRFRNRGEWLDDLTQVEIGRAHV